MSISSEFSKANNPLMMRAERVMRKMNAKMAVVAVLLAISGSFGGGWCARGAVAAAKASELKQKISLLEAENQTGRDRAALNYSVWLAMTEISPHGSRYELVKWMTEKGGEQELAPPSPDEVEILMKHFGWQKAGEQK